MRIDNLFEELRSLNQQLTPSVVTATSPRAPPQIVLRSWAALGGL